MEMSGTSALFGFGGWGKANKSLKTGEAREIINLWTRKSCSEFGSEPARRMMSPSSVVKSGEDMDRDGGS